ncbi:MAG: transporter [Hyphomicrobiales bacterium]|nr:transporter [Hyphomicrobiales bacterium]
MSVGLLALLDDVLSLTKVAAASLDDVAAQASKAGAKAAGVVIDDAAVTPRYVIGLSASRELPIVWKIALGSIRNKLLFLLPGALALSVFAPWAITPILMIGGLYLCYEGAEKVLEALSPHAAKEHEAAVSVPGPAAAADLEARKVASAVKTDFILSAEIMAIALASLPAGSVWMQAIVLAIVGVGITALVYGGVALIVKADDAGIALAANNHPLSAPFTGHSPANRNAPQSSGDELLAPLTRGLGRGLVKAMPYFLAALSVLGTAAMVWVGGGILVHRLETYGVDAIGHALSEFGQHLASFVPATAAAIEWLVVAVGSALAGLFAGALLVVLVQLVGAPILRRFSTKREVERVG